MNLLKGSWALKIIALLFAVATYGYIRQEVARHEPHRPDPSYKLIKLIAKNLPVKVRLATSAPEGYRVLEDGVTTEPPQIVVIGPEALLADTDRAETALLDLSESTKTVTKRIPVENVAGIHLAGDAVVVAVTVPIEKIEAEPAAAKAS